MQTPLTFFFAFVAVLVLIGAVAWLVRRFAGNRLGGNSGRGRMPRLAVIDAAAVDGRRRLVLVRRDNIEHLLMIGGPTDIVVEPNIVRATPARDQIPGRPGSAPEPLVPRSHFPEDDGSHLERFDAPEPALPEPPVAVPRPSRPSFAEDVRRTAPSVPPPLPERRHDPLATISPEPLTRPEPRPDLRGDPLLGRPARSEPVLPRAPLRPAESAAPAKAPPPREPEPPVPPPPPAQDQASADQNLAEMAKRLEAALRRPTESRAASEPPPVVPEVPPAVRPSPRPTSDTAPPVNPPASKGDFENLEDEMASLLGRPKSPS